jgi:hypothetical protein
LRAKGEEEQIRGKRETRNLGDERVKRFGVPFKSTLAALKYFPVKMEQLLPVL